MSDNAQPWRDALRGGLVIPASPLALNADRRWDLRRQLALWRYYAAAGAGGIAVGVHTTQFAIRDPAVGLFQPVLSAAADEMKRHRGLVRIGGICGQTPQAMREAELLRDLDYHAGLLSLAAMEQAGDDELIAHCRAVAGVLPIMGFYLQPAVGGRVLGYSFWRRFCEIENVVAIKIAPFNRYQTIDVVRAAVESGRDDIALYTGNDDNIVVDLLTRFTFRVGDQLVQRRIVGGLLGHWAVWTKAAVELHQTCISAAWQCTLPADLLRLNVEVTDANAALFDAANAFRGCIAGIHEVLRRQGFLEGIWCLDEHEQLSPGQKEEIDRVYAAYPQLNDDDFVGEHLGQWMAG